MRHVRREAYNALRAWGVEVRKPKLAVPLPEEEPGRGTMTNSAAENLPDANHAVFVRGALAVLWFGLALECSSDAPPSAYLPGPAERRGSNGDGSTSRGQKQTASAREQEPEITNDLRNLRDTALVSEDPPVRGSSPAALRAAAKVFRRLNLVGMDRSTVLWILGDPATISDYGIPQDEGANAPLAYVFDSGFGGVIYTLRFDNGKVVQVIEQVLE